MCERPLIKDLRQALNQLDENTEIIKILLKKLNLKVFKSEGGDISIKEEDLTKG